MCRGAKTGRMGVRLAYGATESYALSDRRGSIEDPRSEGRNNVVVSAIITALMNDPAMCCMILLQYLAGGGPSKQRPSYYKGGSL